MVIVSGDLFCILPILELKSLAVVGDDLETNVAGGPFGENSPPKSHCQKDFPDLRVTGYPLLRREYQPLFNFCHAQFDARRASADF